MEITIAEEADSRARVTFIKVRAKTNEHSELQSLDRGSEN